MSDPKKPVDLADARDLAKRLDRHDMPGTAEMMRDMAGELERLRPLMAAVREWAMKPGATEITDDDRC